MTDEKKHTDENSVSSQDELKEKSETPGQSDGSLDSDEATEVFSREEEMEEESEEELEIEVVYPPQDDGGDASESDDLAEDESEADDDEELLEEDLFVSPDDSDVEVVNLDEESESEGGADAEEMNALQEALEAKEAEVADLESKIESLEGEKTEVSKEKEELNTRLLRSVADLENYRRRSEREKEELRKYGIEKVVADLVPAVDNMERALNHAQDQGESNSLVEGIEMVHRQILGTLKKYGVEPFESKGEPFDPQRHEAIQQVESTEVDTGTIIEEYQKGYFIHDRLLRPALVVVAKRVEAAQTEDQEETSADVEEMIAEEAEQNVASGDVEETSETADAEKDDSDES